MEYLPMIGMGKPSPNWITTLVRDMASHLMCMPAIMMMMEWMKRLLPMPQISGAGLIMSPPLSGSVAGSSIAQAGSARIPVKNARWYGLEIQITMGILRSSLFVRNLIQRMCSPTMALIGYKKLKYT